MNADELTAWNLKRLREAKGWTQEGLATEVQNRLGLEWTRDHVAAIERGARRLSVGEVLALAHVFRADLHEFLATDDWVELTAGFRAKGLTELCNQGGWLLETENPASRATAAFMADVDARRTPAERAELAARQQVVQKAARVLRASPMAVMLAARQLWGRSLGAERDRRLGGDGAAQAKGHVTRQLYAELAAVLNSAPISGAQGAREVPDRPRKSRSKVPGKVPERLTARKRPHK
jgi:transcriptional regulator with XRE-family HTH domain